MGRPRTKLEAAVAYFERHNTTIDQYIEDLTDEELDEMYEKISEIEAAVLQAKSK